MKIQTFIVFLILTSILLGCREKITITKIGEATFRRSYADHIYWTDEYFDSVYNSNPDLVFCDEDSNTLKLLERNGFYKDGHLIITKFDNLNANPFTLINNNDTVRISTGFIKTKEESYFGIIGNNKKSKATTPLTDANTMGFAKIETFDIIKGGFKELIVLENYYIMNGDNFVVSIFEIRNK